VRTFLLYALCTIPAGLLLCCGGGDDPPPATPAGDGGTSSSSSSGASTSSSGGSSGVFSKPTTTAGCGKALTASGSGGTEGTTASGRKYLYFIPGGYDPNRAYPLLFTLHGIGATGPDMAQYIKTQEYSAGNAIAVFPSAKNGAWDVNGTQDLDFFDAMIDDLSAAACVNQQRVFALGFSFGAYMVNHLGCERSDRIRALVAAAGGFGGSTAACGRTDALVYHRTEDDDENVANGRAARDHWIRINACTQPTATEAAFGTLGTNLGCNKYKGCSSEVTWCEDVQKAPYKHDLRDVYRVPMWDWFNAKK